MFFFFCPASTPWKYLKPKVAERLYRTALAFLDLLEMFGETSYESWYGQRNVILDICKAADMKSMQGENAFLYIITTDWFSNQPLGHHVIQFNLVLFKCLLSMNDPFQVVSVSWASCPLSPSFVHRQKCFFYYLFYFIFL